MPRKTMLSVGDRVTVYVNQNNGNKCPRKERRVVEGVVTQLGNFSYTIATGEGSEETFLDRWDIERHEEVEPAQLYLPIHHVHELIDRMSAE